MSSKPLSKKQSKRNPAPAEGGGSSTELGPIARRQKEALKNKNRKKATTTVVEDSENQTASNVQSLSKDLKARRTTRTDNNDVENSTAPGAYSSVPGAYSSSPIVESNEEKMPDEEDYILDTKPTGEEEILLEATLVNEDRNDDVDERPTDTTSLPMAADAEILKPQDTFRDFLRSKKGRMCVGLVAIIIIALTVGTVSGMMTRNNNTNNNDEPTQVPSVSLSPSGAPTITHSEVPTVEPTEFVPELFEELLPTDIQRSIQEDPSTPRSRAFTWVLQDDAMFQSSYDRMLQRFVLATLYYATDGDNWINNDGWLSHDEEECNWFAGLDDSSKILNCLSFEILNLNFNGLRGSIPSELGLLTSLSEIHLMMNELTGSFPAHLGNLTLLRHIRISRNRFSGQFPTQIGHLTSLAILDLSDNGFTGSFPTQVGHLRDLVEVTLNNNYFDGWIPTEIGMLVNLRIINWNANLLQGLPSEFGSLEKLSILNLDNNDMQGVLPSEFGLLTQLRILRLGNNSITGTIPMQLSSLTRLRTLIFGINKFSGPITLGIFENWQFISYLSLRDNELASTLPSDFGMLSSIRYFDLTGNNCTGPLPLHMGALTNFEFLDFSNNDFTGEIPPHIGNLTQLNTLNLAGNSLSGTIPSTIGQLRELAALDLGYNDLVGDTPRELNGMTQLTSLGLAGNPNLTGFISGNDICDNLEHELDEFLSDSCQWFDYYEPEIAEPMVIYFTPFPTEMPSAQPSLGSTYSEVRFSIYYQGVPLDRIPTEEELEGILQQTDQFFSDSLLLTFGPRPETELYSINFFRLAMVENDSVLGGTREPFHIDFVAEIHFEMESTWIPEPMDLLTIMSNADMNLYVWDFVVNSEPFGTSFFFNVFSVTFVPEINVGFA